MSSGTSLVDLTPVLVMALLGVVLAIVPLAWWWRRHRHAPAGERLRALTLMTLFLTFDLVVFGAFTRLTDSGLGCPDWPGCYGQASPFGAQSQIDAAQSAMPTGPVTHGKAWIEMVHRYLATGVGVLITVLMVASVVLRRRGAVPVSAWWAVATFLAVCLQGAFGAFTVTLKLYPAIVTAHLLGGLGLLALLAVQSQAYVRTPLPLARGLQAGLGLLALLSLLQIALGGWVSTNYAVLACADFPTCQGGWWPDADFEQGFTVLRPLGLGADGQAIPFAALTAIHLAHRIGAAVVFVALGLMVWRLAVSGERMQRRWAAALAGVAAWQLASGLGNVVLGWPLVAALAHTAGAAALVTLLAVMLTRAWQAARAPRAAGQAGAAIAAS
jgi:heme a synthase